VPRLKHIKSRLVKVTIDFRGTFQPGPADVVQWGSELSSHPFAGEKTMPRVNLRVVSWEEDARHQKGADSEDQNILFGGTGVDHFVMSPSRSLLLITIFVAVVQFVLAFDLEAIQNPPSCTSPSCCNYCNMTYVFPKDSCYQVLEALSAAVNSTKNYEFESSVNNPPSLSAVHTTVSKCCPPFYRYYEDGKSHRPPTDRCSD
jgi:hypothetical protein